MGRNYGLRIIFPYNCIDLSAREYGLDGQNEHVKIFQLMIESGIRRRAIVAPDGDPQSPGRNDLNRDGLKRSTAKESSHTTFARNADGSGQLARLARRGRYLAFRCLDGARCHITHRLLLQLGVHFVGNGNDIWQ